MKKNDFAAVISVNGSTPTLYVRRGNKSYSRDLPDFWTKPLKPLKKKG